MGPIKELLTMYVAHRRTFESNIYSGFHVVWRLRKVATDAIEIVSEKM